MKRLITLLLLSALLAACGGTEEDPAADLPTPEPVPTAVPTIDYGLEVELLTSGSGAAPVTGDVVVMNYVATLEDGTVIDETEETPFQFVLGSDRLVRGLEQALLQIPEGGTARVTVPPELGYGERGAGDVVPPDATLIYEVEIVEVNPFNLPASVSIPEGAELIETPGGVEVYVIEPGEGPTPEAGDTVVAHYRGVLPDGTQFDSSYERDQPFSFELVTGSVIQGWHEGFGVLSEGAQAVLIIPPELGYGAQGSPPVIPPNATLIFEVELLEVNP
jgi:peptidylprolyl isomerase